MVVAGGQWAQRAHACLKSASVQFDLEKPAQRAAFSFALVLSAELSLMLSGGLLGDGVLSASDGALLDALQVSILIAFGEALLDWRRWRQAAAGARSCALRVATLSIAAFCFEYSLHILLQLLFFEAASVGRSVLNALILALAIGALSGWLSLVDEQVALVRAKAAGSKAGRSSNLAVLLGMVIIAVTLSSFFAIWSSVREIQDLRFRGSADIVNLMGGQRFFSQRIGRMALMEGREAEQELVQALFAAETQGARLQILVREYLNDQPIDDDLRAIMPGGADYERARARYLQAARLHLRSGPGEREVRRAALQAEINAALPLWEQGTSAFVRLWEEKARNSGGPLSWVSLSILFVLLAGGLIIPVIRLARETRLGLAQSADRARRSLADLEAYQTALDQHAIVAMTDARGRIIFANDKFCQISGYERDELIGQTHAVLNSGTHPREFFINLWRTIGRGETWSGEVCNRAKNGALYWVATTIVPFLGENGRPDRYVSLRYDITARKHEEARAALRSQIAVYVAAMQGELLTKGSIQTSLSSALDGVLEAARGRNLVVCAVEPGEGGLVSSVLAHRARPPQCSEPFSIVNDDDLPASLRALAQSHALFGEMDSDLFARGPHRLVPVRAGHDLLGFIAVAVGDDSADDVREVLADYVVELARALGDLLVAHREVDRRRCSEEEAQRQARFDALTGLGNRRWLREEFENRIDHPEACVAMLLIDLDRFKPINDTHGHLVGDKVLQIVAHRLNHVVRGDCAIARLGGDEFAILTEPTITPTEAIDMATRVLGTLEQPIGLDGLSLSIGASIGVALFPFDADDCEQLLRKADAAMYRAKDMRGAVKLFDSELDDGIKIRAELETDLRIALGQGDLAPYFQPVVALANGDVIGHEVLARWHSKERGLVSPSQFIPIAEEAGLIDTIFWSLTRMACAEHKRLHKGTMLAVNLSPAQIKDPLLAQRLLQMLNEVGFAPQRLEIEITESAMLSDIERARNLFGSLKNLGVRLALDDFGTGYASLSLLRDLPLDKVKIDRSFVAEIGAPGVTGAPIVEAILGMARALNLEVTAEGVETSEAALFLRELGCQYGQGYLFGRPQPCLIGGGLLLAESDLPKAIGAGDAGAAAPQWRQA